jgi:arylsulfatase A-like enzyme
VHAPLEAPEPLRAKHAARLGEGPRATYAAMVESVDANLGRLLDLLAELDLEERTLVLFTSDNGGLASVSSLAPLRGEKGTLHEAGLRVPLVMRWPGRVGGGVVVAAPVIGCDLMPTVLQLCAVPCPPVDGESLVPLLLDEGGGRGAGRLEREALFWHFPAYLEPYGDATAFRARPAGAVRRGRYKLIEHFEDGRLELYDLRDDPGEAHDLSAERGELRDELQRLLAGWREELGAPVPTERNPDFRR